MEYVSLFFLWSGLVFLIGWKRNDGRKGVFCKHGGLLCVFLFLLSTFLWNYLFR